MSEPRRCRSHAFGFTIESRQPITGLPLSDFAYGPPTQLEVTDASTIDSVWPAQSTIRLLDERADTSPGSNTIDEHERAGYRLYAAGYGLAQIAADGRLVRYAPARRDKWDGLRFLLGRVLPWTALLRGLEVFHASAVSIDSQGVAFLGPAGAGKSSLAVRLVAAGAHFLTDDVLAIDRDADGALRAHPGASIASLREHEWQLVGTRKGGFGTLLGHGTKLHVELPRSEQPAPLRLVYLLRTPGGERGEDDRDSQHPAIESISAPDPRVLLGGTFVRTVQTPARLRNQLDVCAQLARSAHFFTVRTSPRVPPDELAAALEGHTHAALSTSRSK